MVERDLFDGSLTPKEIACFLYLRARGDRFAELWQIQKRLSSARQRRASRPTVNRILSNLALRGLARNYGTRQTPRWGPVSLKNPTFKKAGLKNPPFKKATHSPITCPSHQISPSQVVLDKHTGASPANFDRANSRTDLPVGSLAPTGNPEQASTSAGPAMGTGAAHLPFSRAVLVEVTALGVDVDGLINRYRTFAEKAAATGRPISDPSAYLLKMARDANAKAQGVATEDLPLAVDALKGIASPNRWTKVAALARVVRAPPAFPPDPERARIAARLSRDGLDPRATEADCPLAPPCRARVAASSAALRALAPDRSILTQTRHFDFLQLHRKLY
jgi:hypothetical protein